MLAVHLAALEGVPGGWSPSADAAPPPPPPPFLTRTIRPPPPPPPPAPPAPRPPPPRPAPRPAPEPAAAPETPPAPAAEPAPAEQAPAPLDTTAAADPAPAPAPPPAEPPPAPPPEAPAPAAPVRLPDSRRLLFDASGEVKGFSYSARAELSWQHDGSRYRARQEIGAFLVGSRSQTSEGTVTPQGLAPVRFADKTRSERAAHFDYDRGKVVFSANTPEAPLLPGTQDRLSVFLQLSGLLAADPGRYPVGAQISIPTVSARDAETWVFVVEGQEQLDLPAGGGMAWKLARAPRKPHDMRAEIWLAPDLGYLPVRIRLEQSSGDVADLKLRAVE
ncbi:MAG: Agglutinin receptor [Xylophilus sp.]|nr:MAG: Agglutinin receptor [Xylophilus sp.]